MAGELLPAVERTAFDDDKGEVPRNRVQTTLVELLRQTALTKSPQDRAAAGRALARIGDIRAGVGCRGDGQNALPDLAWVPIPGTADTGLKNGVKLGLGAGADDLAREDERWAERARGVVIEPFYMAAFPITYLQFAVFVDADYGYCQDSNWTDAGLQDRADRKQPSLWRDPQWHISNHPVVGMTWYEAVAFCRWLTARWYQAHPKNYWIIRLPTEAEWEWAARGPSARRWPWGDQWDDYSCNSKQRGLNRTVAVRSDPGNSNWVSAYQNKVEIDALPTSSAMTLSDGVFDLAGNVWEWCVTKWHDRYTVAQVHGSEQWTADYCRGRDRRVLRGGAYWNEKRLVRGAARGRLNSRIRRKYGGFRCCCVSTSSGASVF